MLPEEFGCQGAAGKADWAIARRSILGALGESETGDAPVERRPDERVIHGQITLDSQAQQELRRAG